MTPKYKFPKATEKTKQGILFIIILGSFIYNFTLFRDLMLENRSLEDEISKVHRGIQIFQNSLLVERSKNQNLQSSLSIEKENNDLIKNQIQTISSTVGVLEKLSKTDSELLKKYSKIYFLNENYIPQKLTDIDPKYLLQKDKAVKIHSDVWPHLQRMLEDSIAVGLDIKILSGYRSFTEQASLKSNYKVTFGSGANKFSADQGYSEHQLGTTLDFTTSKNGALLGGFDKTKEYEWLQSNAYKYGFIISYPKENKFYIFEPWHWRYVGVNLATRIRDNNTYLYSLDQRDIDGYLIDLFN